MQCARAPSNTSSEGTMNTYVALTLLAVVGASHGSAIGGYGYGLGGYGGGWGSSIISAPILAPAVSTANLVKAAPIPVIKTGLAPIISAPIISAPIVSTAGLGWSGLGYGGLGVGGLGWGGLGWGGLGGLNSWGGLGWGGKGVWPSAVNTWGYGKGWGH